MAYIYNEYATFFRVLSNKTRFTILKVLNQAAKEMSVSNIAVVGNISISKISDQLTVLRKNDLVKYRRQGNLVNYCIDKKKFYDQLFAYYKELATDLNDHYISFIFQRPFDPECLNIYKVLANETRCEIMIHVAKKNLSVSELCNMFYLEQPTISMHLRYMKQLNLISSKRQKTLKYYFISPNKVAQKISA